MSLNTKSDEAHKLARELADLTGESMAAAVIEALRERLDRLRRGPEEEFVARILAIGRDCAAHLPESYKAIDPDELLYDEYGLPRDC